MKLHMGLTPKITLAFILFATAILVGVGLLSYKSGRESLISATTSELLSSALFKESQIDNLIKWRLDDIQVLANSPALIDAMTKLDSAQPRSATAQLAKAQAIRTLKPHTEVGLSRNLQIGIVELANGKILLGTDPAMEGLSVVDQSFFTEGKVKSHVQYPHISNVIRSHAMAIGTPLRSAQGSVLGVLVVWIDLTDLNNIALGRSGLHRSDEAFLVNTNRQFVTQPRLLAKPSVLMQQVDTVAVKRCVAGNSGIYFGADYRGIPSIVIYRWLPKHKLGLISKIEEKEALALVHEFGQTITLFSLLILLVTTLFAIVLARSITRPIKDLQAGVARFGQGDMEIQLPADPHTELGRLGNEFNQMATAITKNEAQLKANAALLEQRVQERTRTLQQQADLLELAHDGIIVHSMDGTIQFWNRGAQELYGWASKETIGRKVFVLLNTVYPVSWDDVNATLLNSGHWEGELIQTSRDGKRITVSSGQALQRDEHGHPMLVLVINNDITERKQVLQDLELAKETAEGAVRIKSTFLANMSHEIRTPMNGVIGLTNLVLKTPLTQQQQEYMTLIRTSSNALLSLLNDILDFSKIEAQKLVLENIEFDLRESLGNTLKTFSASANEKGLELVYQVAPDIPMWVTGDPGRLAQIIINIVGNAIKFTQQGQVALRVVQDSRTSDCCLLHFSVSDTGIGISEQQQGHIFDAFTQADSSTTRQFGGTGLGLAIVSQLIKLMGGEIWVESESGKGTTFHFTAQFGLPANPPLNTLASQVSALKNLPVLVVDDNATIRLVLAEILSSWHMRPTLAESGQQGLDELSRAAKAGTPFKLVLLDAHMPEFDGYQLIEAIQTMPARNSSTVMMLASNDISAEVARCATLGIKRILTKPIKPSELFDAIMMVTGMVGNDEGLIDVKQIAISEKPLHLLRVLVAEDHPINQKLVIEILRERGHTFAIANNGKEVLQMLDQQVFDVILMDGQMPEMDGYEATREIRRREQATGQHMRIIAVTANAMKGDREVCLAAGMDDYLSKPIDSDQLLEKLEQGDGITNVAISENQDAEEVTTHTGKVFDVESALKRMRGKEVLLKQMVQIFLNDLPAALVEIEAAISNNDMQLMERAAHKLKGTAATLSAEALTQSAEKIEHFSKNRATNHLPQAMKQLKACASELMVEMEKYTGVKI